MNNALLFDMLLVIIVLLFALIGFWRGVVKEGLAAGGILFGALLAENWSSRFGSIVSNVLNVTSNAGKFFTVEALLLACSLVIGYGSGSLLVAPVRGLSARLGGGVLGAMNAALLLAFTLRAVHQYVDRSSTQRLLDDSLFSRALVERFNWFLLIVTGIVLVLLFGRLVTERESKELNAPRDLADRPRRSARLPAPRDEGKLEPPGRGFNASTARFESDRPSLDHLALIPPILTTEMSLDRAAAPSDLNPVDDRNDEWRTLRFSHDSTVQKPVDQKRWCTKCGEFLSEDDVFCPACGQPAIRNEYE